MTDLLDKFPARMRQARERRGFTPAQLARLLGVSRSVPYRWESGEAWPSLPHLVAFSDATGTDLHWLLTGQRPRRGS